ncbi:MAG: RNA polymerase sigma factor [Bacteroidota bacterium]
MTPKEKERQFEAFYRDYQHKLYRLCCSFCGDEEADVADLYQEILLQIWKALPGFRGQAQLSTWAYRIAINTGTAFRRNRTRRHLPRVIKDADLPAQEQHPKDERLQQLRAGIARLLPSDRLLITLQLEGLSYAEIAAISGHNTNQIGVRLHRAKRRLHKMLLPYEN